MTPKQLQEVIKALSISNEKVTERVVKETVNGKIDKLNVQVGSLNKEMAQQKELHKELSGMLEELKDIIELKRGASVVGKIGKWLGSLAVFGYIIKWYFLR